MIRNRTLRKLIAERDRAFQREREQFLQERSDLLNRIMYLCDKPWDQPAQVLVPEEPSEMELMEFRLPVDIYPEDNHYSADTVV